VELLGARLRTVERIGHAKSGLGIPIRDFRVEAQVVSRMVEGCRALGVDGDLGKHLADLLIDASIRVQNSILDRSYGGGLQRVVVLGGRGNMGSWLCRFLRAQGHRVVVVDPAGPLEGFAYGPSLDEALPGADAILLATPLGGTPAILEEVIDQGPEGLVVDVCSLKAPLLGQIRRGIREGMRVTSIHPMFSSTVGSLAGKNVVVCRCGSPGADEQAKEFFAGTGANLPEIAVEDHDELMAYVLGLGHALNIAFAVALVGSGRPLASLEALAGYTFARQAQLARDVVGENPRLYYEIQALNPHMSGVLGAYGRALDGVREAASGGKEGAFMAMMEAGRKYFAGGGHG
jgi:chorismate mutase/prephenate dehydrogenase